MKIAVFNFLLFCFVGLYNSGVSSLQCYNCYGSYTGINKCLNNEEFLKAREGAGDQSLVKNCTPPFDKICYREVYIPNGTVTSYIIDCGDDKTFTFNHVPDVDYSNLTNHPNDGNNVCAGPPDKTFCLTKCDTDFCNGPQPSSAKTLTISRIFYFVVCFLSFVFR